MKRHLLSVADLSSKQVLRILDQASALRKEGAGAPLRGRSVALLFQKPSLRTKVSFSVAVAELGGTAIYLGPEEVGLGKREAPQDVARVLSRMVQAIVFRAMDHRDVETVAKNSSVPVINALSDVEHPCQALADLYTIQQRRGALPGQVVTFVGDGNNVAVSLAFACALTGARFRIASPPGYELPRPLLDQARRMAAQTGGTIDQTADPWISVKNADVVYTDVWTSMGQERETEQRRVAFKSYQVTEELFSLAKPDAIFMHPLPAHRGEEVSSAVLEHSRSAVFEQAENRLHVQKALLLDLVGGDGVA